MAHARRGLEQEIVAQHSTQGVNKEEAAEYIQFITDFFLIPYVVAERNRQPFSLRYRQTLEHILDYIFSLMDQRGNIPFYGDEDDGKVVFFDSNPPDNFRSLLVSGVILFGHPAWKNRTAGIDNKNLVLFGEVGRQTLERMTADTTPPPSRFYVAQGHFIMRASSQKQETYVHLDAAPLGFLSIAAHGHADALSWVLHVDGLPIITDVGTYTYHTEPTWRSYFIGTLAHNTVRVNGQDQAKSTGPTMWTNHYQVKVLRSETSETHDLVVAEHNGYQRLGVTHRRTFSLDKTSHTIRIVDDIVLDRPAKHTLELPLHLHPAVSVDLSDSAYRLVASGARPVLVHPDPALTLSVVHGETDPILGWYSPSFQQKGPTSVLYCTCAIQQTTQLVTEVVVG